MAREHSPQDEQGYYLFGVLPADADVSVEGCPSFDEGCRVRLVRTANLLALVAEVPFGAFEDSTTGDPERLTALVRDHDAILREVAASGRAVAPVPFGTVTRDLDALRRLVEEHAVDLHDALARLEGCDEWGVHVSVPRSAAQRAVRSMAREVHERLAAASEDAVIEPVESGARETRPSVLSAAFLVNRDRQKRFAHTVEELQGFWGMAEGTIRLSGPWPPYHFARLDLGAAASPGASVLLGPLSAPDRAWST